MDCGLGNLWGGKSWCGLYRTWADIYKYEPDMGVSEENKHWIIGGELAIWGEL